MSTALVLAVASIDRGIGGNSSLFVLTVALTVALTIALTNSEFGTVVLGTALGDGHEDRLVVRGTAHSTHAVVSCWEAFSHIGRQQAVSIAVVVDTFEEGKSGRIRSASSQLCFREIMEGRSSRLVRCQTIP